MWNTTPASSRTICICCFSTIFRWNARCTHIRPIALPGRISGMKAQWYHATPQAFTREATGEMMTFQTNLPAFHQEPFAPPPAELQPWLYVFYVAAKESGASRDPAEYWPAAGKEMFLPFKAAFTKLEPDLVKAALPIKSETDIDTKIAKALEICRTVQPLQSASPALQKKFTASQTASDALKRGVGSSGNIRTLFVSLLMAAGLDVRPAFAADRSVMFMQPASANVDFLRTFVFVVRSSETSRFVDPLNRFSPTGSLRWQQENEPILVAGESDGGLARVPLSGAYLSVKTRTANVQLTEDGSIDGDLRGEFAGHWSEINKEQDLTMADREKSLKQGFVELMKGAEIADMKIEGVDSPKEPYTYSLHLKMTNYAQRTGSRMFVRPAVFEYGEPPTFATANRTHPVYFPFPWTERDTVTLKLPEGYVFDDVTPPPAVKFGNHLSYEYALTIAPDRKQAVFSRTLVVCNAKQILFGPEDYSGIKKFFDLVSQNDAFALAVRKASAQ